MLGENSRKVLSENSDIWMWGCVQTVLPGELPSGSGGRSAWRGVAGGLRDAALTPHRASRFPGKQKCPEQDNRRGMGKSITSFT